MVEESTAPPRARPKVPYADITRYRQYQLKYRSRPEYKARSGRWYAENRERAKARMREYHARNKDRLNAARRARNTPESQREAHLKKYGLTLADFADMLTAQRNRCAICRTPEPTKKGWHVDHDHATGRVRGILCHYCNQLLANAKDSPERLLAAVAYLSHEAVVAGKVH